MAQLLTLRAAAAPQRTALLDVRGRKRRRLTFSQLEQAAAQAAGLFFQAGLRPGDAVLVFQPMSIELYIALAALFRSGLVAMFLDPTTGRDHIERCCALGAPRGLIACPKAHLLRFRSPSLRRIPIQFSVGMRLPWAESFFRWSQTPPKPDIHDCSPDCPALVTFTTGSTREPKAALRTHGFLLNQQRVLENSLQLQPGEVDLTTVPTFALANLASGVTTVISGAGGRSLSRAQIGALIRQLKEQRVDRMGGAPAFFAQLTEFCRARGETLPAMRKIYSGGGPVFPKLLDQLAAVAPHARIHALYGCTEAEPISLLERSQISAQDQAAMEDGAGLLAGLADREIAVRIVAEPHNCPVGPLTTAAFDSVCLPRGSAGEIVVSGPHVLGSYLGGVEDTQFKIRVEGTVWHRTGDAGFLDRQDRLWLLGRCGARVDDAHGTLYPLQIESAIRQRTDAGHAAVVSNRGRRRLFVDRRGREALAKLTDVLQRWQIAEVHVINDFPVDKRHRSKIDYQALREAAAGERPSLRSTVADCSSIQTHLSPMGKGPLPTNPSWSDQINAKQKVIEPLVQRAVDRVRTGVASRRPKMIDSLFYGAIGIDPKHLVIWFIFQTTAEKRQVETSGFAQELDLMSRAALRVEGYPEVAIELIQVAVASNEEIVGAGGWDFFR